jgi:hypothetical protein
VSAEKVVKDDYVFASLAQQFHGYAADVTGAAGDESGHRLFI